MSLPPSLMVVPILFISDLRPMTDLFVIASRKKFRFASERGDLTVEQLWDLPLTSKNGFNLNTIAIAINSELKGLAEESFVETSSNPRRRELEQMLEIAKFIIATKQDETKAASERLARQAMRNKLQEAIEAKEDQALVGSSIEELKAQLAALS